MQLKQNQWFLVLILVINLMSCGGSGVATVSAGSGPGFADQDPPITAGNADSIETLAGFLFYTYLLGGGVASEHEDTPGTYTEKCPGGGSATITFTDSENETTTLNDCNFSEDDGSSSLTIDGMEKTTTNNTEGTSSVGYSWSGFIGMAINCNYTRTTSYEKFSGQCDFTDSAGVTITVADALLEHAFGCVVDGYVDDSSTENCDYVSSHILSN